MIDFAARAKYDAWANAGKMHFSVAMMKYVATVTSLAADWLDRAEKLGITSEAAAQHFTTLLSNAKKERDGQNDAKGEDDDEVIDIEAYDRERAANKNSSNNNSSSSSSSGSGGGSGANGMGPVFSRPVDFADTLPSSTDTTSTNINEGKNEAGGSTGDGEATQPRLSEHDIASFLENGVKWLEEKKTKGDLDVSARDENGQSLIHLAVDNGDIESLRVLIEMKADVNQRLVDGQTPLHAACWLANSDCALALLDAGADKDAKDMEGITARQIIQENLSPPDQAEMVEVLKRLGAAT